MCVGSTHADGSRVGSFPNRTPCAGGWPSRTFTTSLPDFRTDWCRIIFGACTKAVMSYVEGSLLQGQDQTTTVIPLRREFVRSESLGSIAAQGDCVKTTMRR